MRRSKKFVILFSAVLFLLTLICNTAYADTVGAFPDVPEDADYAEAVEVLADLGIFTGDDKGNFKPNNTITRAECAAIICRMLGVEDEAKAMKNQVFPDVPASFWGAGYIAKAAELGIIGGYGNGKFGPNDSVTQVQVVKMLVCAIGLGDQAMEEGGWPNGYVKIASEYGIIEPLDIHIDDVAPRWMIAILVYNALYS